MLNEGSERGHFVGIDPRQRMVQLRIGNNAHASSLAFNRIRYLAFEHPLKPHKLPHEQKTNTAIKAPTRTSRPCWVHFLDTSRLTLRVRSILNDELGLHLFQEHKDGRLQRLFVPRENLLDYRVGPLIGNQLMADGNLQQPQLDQALQEQRQRRSGSSDTHSPHPSNREHRLGAILQEMQAITPEALQTSLADKIGLPTVRLKEVQVELETLQLIPAELARSLRILPLFRFEDRLVVAMEDPTDSEALAMIRFITGIPVDIVVAERHDLELAINRHYADAVALSAARPRADDETSPTVRLVDELIREAVARRASDLHLQPRSDRVDLVLRIDGSLLRVRSLDRNLLPPLTSRIKVLAGMNLAEHRLPQDGRTHFKGPEGEVDLRISILPTVHGESVVIRILDPLRGLRSIEELGLKAEDRKRYNELINRSHGMLLVTGPTGSGKSTTLYATLGEVRKRDVNIITVEDPVEYRLDGIQQIQMHHAIGLDFSRALRNILRHDPDVIMVGEIRDRETASIAVESALTGHLLLSTLHTNDAASTITRLLEMGIEPFMLNSALIGVLAQRLVRRNCPHCVDEEPVEPAVREALGIKPDEQFQRGRGCEQCDHTGYRGRISVYELLTVTAELRALIRPGVQAPEIAEQARRDGMVPLTDNALDRAREGLTSLSEVYRVRLS
jgi:type IV pilus assembly protein PilB